MTAKTPGHELVDKDHEAGAEVKGELYSEGHARTT